MGGLTRIFSWALRKLAFGALLAALGMIGASLWVFLHEAGDFDTQQREAVHVLSGAKSKIDATLADADRRAAELQTRIAARQWRADQAARVARELDDLSGTLDWFTVSSDQLKENSRRLARMKEMEADSLTRILDLRQGLVHIQVERDGMEIALARTQAQLKTATEETSPGLHYVRAAWEAYGRWVLLGVVLVMLAPALWRFVSFCRS
jgi:chromosome segregation ATPase